MLLTRFNWLCFYLHRLLLEDIMYLTYHDLKRRMLIAFLVNFNRFFQINAVDRLMYDVIYHYREVTKDSSPLRKNLVVLMTII